MRKINQNEPINHFLSKNRKKNPVSFHMPGHKYGRFHSRKFNGYFADYDITEISGADNIKNPVGIIGESLKEISRIYGSKSAFYLTNGTTSGIHSILRYAALTGKKIILSRDCHISAVNGAILFGIDTIFIPLEYKNGIPVSVSADAVSNILKKNPDACGVLITSPNYYGKTAQIEEISKTVHEKGMFLAVDEAHGAHFQFSGLAHLSGINSGADIVCHSLHKTLPVYNQGAVLHVCSERININMIRSIINMLGTTSPSYPLLASMEKAVIQFHVNGSLLYRKLKKEVDRFKNFIEEETACNIVDTDDFTRLVIKTGINGFDVANMLHEKFNIDVEAADFDNVICITTPYNRKSDFRKMKKAVATIKKQSKTRKPPDVPGNPEIELQLSKAFLMKMETVPLDMAAGRICGTIIVSYPPGTPLVCPGEIIDGYVVDYIKKVLNAGGAVLGIEDNKIPVLE